MVLSGLEEFIIFGFLPLMIGVFAGPVSSRTSEQIVAGRISIPRPSPFPSDAVMVIELVEMRRGETILPVIAHETISWRGAESQKFAVRFDPTFIRPTAFYGLRAHIIADGTVWFETLYPQPTAPLSGDTMTLVLASAAERA